MGFQNVALLPSSACLSITFLKNCGRGEDLRTDTCLEAVVGISKDMLPIKKILL